MQNCHKEPLLSQQALATFVDEPIILSLHLHRPGVPVHVRKAKAMPNDRTSATSALLIAGLQHRNDGRYTLSMAAAGNKHAMDNDSTDMKMR